MRARVLRVTPARKASGQSASIVLLANMRQSPQICVIHAERAQGQAVRRHPLNALHAMLGSTRQVQLIAVPAANRDKVLSQERFHVRHVKLANIAN